MAIAVGKDLSVQFSNLHVFPKDINGVDVITAFDLLEHVDLPGTTLKEIYNVLATGGYFVFSTLCVTNYDPSDYWFNNSLEHYIYYDEESLKYILTDVFGENNFYFTEIVNNGISEFWGVAKKGSELGKEKRIIDSISGADYSALSPDEAYLMALFLNQVSRFEQAGAIIDTFSDRWTQRTGILAKFYNLYFSGGFERIMGEVFTARHLIPSKEYVFWQALTDVADRMSTIRLEDLASSKDATITGLQDSIYDLQMTIADFRNSFLVGNAIRARSLAGRIRHKMTAIIHLPKKVLHSLRVALAPFVPSNIRQLTKRLYRGVRNGHELSVSRKTLVNTRWNGGTPLVSVVVPYYNAGATIMQTLRSIYGQSFSDLEVTLVDD